MMKHKRVRVCLHDQLFRQQNVNRSIGAVCAQGHMVAKGTYTELQQSGLDFTSLLRRNEEEEEEQLAPQDRFSRSRTLSENSVRSLTSSVHSDKDGDYLPVRNPPVMRSDGFLILRVNPGLSRQAEAVHMVPEESRADGTISVKLYVKYLRSGGSMVALLLVVLMNLTAQVNRKRRRPAPF